MAEHTAAGGSVIDASEERFELQIQIFIQSVYKFLARHGNGMTHHVRHRQFEATLYAPRLVKGHPTGPLQRQSRNNNAMILLLMTLQLLFDRFYRRGIAHLNSDNSRPDSLQMLFGSLSGTFRYRFTIAILPIQQIFHRRGGH